MKAGELVKYGHLSVLMAGLAFGGIAIDPAIAQEQGYGEDSADNPNDSTLRNSSNPYDIKGTRKASPDATRRITRALRGSYDFCARINKRAYLVDCLGERLEDIAKAMPKSGDYGEARKILQDAGKKMRRVVASNKAPNVPRTRASGVVSRKKVTTKPLTAVRQDRIKQVSKEAAAILAEAETKLLRSAGASDRRLIAYAQMAKAVGSNKTLLRSA